MIGNFKRFDLARRPNPQWRVLTPVTWALSFPEKWARRASLTKIGMEGVKPPFLLLCNHNAFLDFKVMTAALFPRRANYVVAIDGFIGMEWLLRAVGCIGNRKFTNSALLVRNMIAMMERGEIVVLFPEARYSLCGTQAVLPDSVGKLIRLLNVPVVSLLMHGHHLNRPFWDAEKRKVPRVEAEMRLLFTKEDASALPASAINARLRETFVYDEYAWQKQHGIRVTHKNRAQGLHHVLYQCPHCGAEYRMESGGDALWCGECGARWRMSELGELRAESGETVFSHIPDWYEWERENVRREVRDGTYSLTADVRVDSLPNTRGFIDLGAGVLTHNMDGFTLTGTCGGARYEERWPTRALYSCHIEYNYKKKGPCVDLNTQVDTLYIFPRGRDFSVTKIALATEELYLAAGSRRAKLLDNAADLIYNIS
ncbi:MAG: 1-acyl-sn-glycerol-3-phosphate acyltransferase [Oscillospiraceae bacterium]|jgi:1-acyl-sn-glycerol-3-phosphate acyltransferase/transcription elongation factor Elf1|nr:1-acyl-sn-glycerol-3-phosphate acyltransferase [Oscillospiraceae bacterium]